MSEIITTLHEKGTPANEIYPNIKGENIPDNAITTPKVNNNAITSAKIQDGAIITSKIDDGAVTTTKIVNNAITTNKINDGAVTFDKLSGSLQDNINHFNNIYDEEDNENVEESTPQGTDANPNKIIKLGDFDNWAIRIPDSVIKGNNSSVTQWWKRQFPCMSILIQVYFY